MQFSHLTIGSKKPLGKRKGRCFSVHYVASVQARQLVPMNNGVIRPVLLAFAGSVDTIRAFSANLRLGLVAEKPGSRFELLRSLGYRLQTTSPIPGQALVIAYLPEFFHLQPGVQDQDDTVRFVSAPPLWWLEQQEALLRHDFGPLARDYARAMAFVARLDARTPLPIANDPAFHHALFLDALKQPWATTERHYQVFNHDGLDDLGLDAPVLCDVSQQDFAEFLATTTAKHLPSQSSTPRRPMESPLLAPATQLSLAFRTA